MAWQVFSSGLDVLEFSTDCLASSGAPAYTFRMFSLLGAASQTLRSIVNISLFLWSCLSFQWPLGPSLLLWIYAGRAPFQSEPHHGP